MKVVPRMTVLCLLGVGRRCIGARRRRFLREKGGGDSLFARVVANELTPYIIINPMHTTKVVSTIHTHSSSSTSLSQPMPCAGFQSRSPQTDQRPGKEARGGGSVPAAKKGASGFAVGLFRQYLFLIVVSGSSREGWGEGRIYRRARGISCRGVTFFVSEW